MALSETMLRVRPFRDDLVMALRVPPKPPLYSTITPDWQNISVLVQTCQLSFKMYSSDNDLGTEEVAVANTCKGLWFECVGNLTSDATVLRSGALRS